MKVRPVAASRISRETDDLSSLHMVSHSHIGLAQVQVHAAELLSPDGVVANFYDPLIGYHTPERGTKERGAETCLEDFAGRDGLQRRTHRHQPIVSTVSVHAAIASLSAGGDLEPVGIFELKRQIVIEVVSQRIVAVEWPREEWRCGVPGTRRGAARQIRQGFWRVEASTRFRVVRRGDAVTKNARANGRKEQESEPGSHDSRITERCHLACRRGCTEQRTG
jgi:hypothetical protein